MSDIPKPLALVCSDLHLSHRPPVARSTEPDWYATMKRGLDWLKACAGAHGDIPVLCAGDIFDRWNSPPELINFAIKNLPFMYCVPGQHDLPQHDIEGMHRSAYGTLVAADAIADVDQPCRLSTGATVWGFPWGAELCKCDRKDDWPKIALVHRYIHISKGTDYPGATTTQLATIARTKLKGFDFAVFGDNHKGFTLFPAPEQISKITTILNTGTFFPRTIAEKEYTPTAYVLYDNGTFKECNPPTSGNKWHTPENVLQATDFIDFIESLETAEIRQLDFPAACMRYGEQAGASKQVFNLLKKACE